MSANCVNFTSVCGRRSRKKPDITAVKVALFLTESPGNSWSRRMRILAVSLGLVLFCALWSPRIALSGEAEWQANMNAGAAAMRRGDYQNAAARFEAARKEAEPYGASDKRLLITLFILAQSYGALGRHAEADRLYRHVILSLEKTLGSEHPEVASA